ncbi:hypothetical protein C474_08012 [Halogeometricum pallidum JCM 14848]|uniref:Lipoprotein n=1 Tax=Halogeometricum pallidum JCM 14848 TaxID=1227487 RepID=M0DA99_HALPD|nr:hypothetical protein [Halogeometricum pallidum]ELZ31652.1 hypothetical protein C474_08012 [Halogeometricum pallidum JCM 14848]
MARTAPHLVLVLLVLLAGCNGVFGAPDARTSESAAPTATPEPVSYPPGVTDDGVADAVELVGAHQRATANMSYVSNRTVTLRYPNGTRIRQIREVRHGVGDDVYYLRQRTVGEEGAFRSRAAFEIWTNETVSVLSIPNEGERRFARLAEEGTIRQQSRGRLLALFARIETTTTGTTRDGRPLVHLLGTGNLTGEMRATGIQNIAVESFSAAVTPTGVVRSYSIRYEGTLNGESVSVREEYRLEPSEKRTVDRPGWVSTAVERTNASSS